MAAKAVYPFSLVAMAYVTKRTGERQLGWVSNLSMTVLREWSYSLGPKAQNVLVMRVWVHEPVRVYKTALLINTCPTEL